LIDADLGPAGAAWLAGDESTPAGAAAVALVADRLSWTDLDRVVAFAEVWLAERGPAFAAAAATELMTLLCQRGSGGQVQVRRLRPTETRPARGPDATRPRPGRRPWVSPT
jgi:hypothetical protein